MSTDLLGEVWRTAQECPDYEVSSEGRVRRRTPGTGRARPGRFLVAPPDSRGYRQMQVSSTGKRQTFFVHHLVAKAFVGPRPDGMYINHINMNKLDNRAVNLEWVTPAENTIKGETTSWARLNEQTVKVMRFMHRNHPKPGLVDLMARLHGVSNETARKAVVGINWKEVRMEAGR